MSGSGALYSLTLSLFLSDARYLCLTFKEPGKPSTEAFSSYYGAKHYITIPARRFQPYTVRDSSTSRRSVAKLVIVSSRSAGGQGRRKPHPHLYLNFFACMRKMIHTGNSPQFLVRRTLFQMNKTVKCLSIPAQAMILGQWGFTSVRQGSESYL